MSRAWLVARLVRSICGLAVFWASPPTTGAAGGADATWGGSGEESPLSLPESNAPRISSTGIRITVIHEIRTSTETVEGVTAHPEASTARLLPNTSAPWTGVPLRSPLGPI
jgi:hypothetical protein